MIAEILIENLDHFLNVLVGKNNNGKSDFLLEYQFPTSLVHFQNSAISIHWQVDEIQISRDAIFY